MASLLKKGDKVQYSSSWLRSVGLYTGDYGRAKGVVLGVKKINDTTQVVSIRWDKPDIPTKVLNKNLSKMS